MGPGFFIFFQNEGHQTVLPSTTIAPAKSDDDEVIELVKIIFTFLESEYDT